MQGKRIRRLTAGLVVGGALAAPSFALAEPYVHQTQATATGTGGAAATVDSVATQAAAEELSRGGNAIDAAVVAAAVLGVTEPFSCGIGGGGYMVIRTADGKVTSIDHRERAPRAMQPNSFIENGRALAFNDARYSGLSAGVPGTVEGWRRALARYGTLPLGDALRPAIDVAEQGFRIDPTFFSQVTDNVDYFNDIPSSAALYLDPDGTPKDVGSVQTNPDMARTYRRIARSGARDGFYRGPVARAMVAATKAPPVAANANHRWRPGLMTEQDLAEYASRRRTPTRINYRGLDVYGMGPSSSGGSTVGETLNILELAGLEGASRTQALHVFLEANKLAFADRNAFLADPAFEDIPLRGLLSDAYATTRRNLINPTQAARAPVAPGNPAPFNTAGQPSVTTERIGSTTHLTTADRAGNVVSYTFTIESTGGNGIVVPGWGFLMNNELTDFNYESTTHPNRPNGRKRPRSSMSPTIVTRGGQPFLAVGSPGGSTIITTVGQVLFERIDQGATLPAAIATPRASQRNTATVTAEPGFITSPAGQALLGYGHAYTSTGEIGAVTGIEFLPNGRFLAAAEPTRRGGGGAAVVEEDE